MSPYDLPKLRYPREERVDRVSELVEQYARLELGIDLEDRESVEQALLQLFIDMLTWRQWLAEELEDPSLRAMRWVVPAVACYRDQAEAYGS